MGIDEIDILSPAYWAFYQIKRIRVDRKQQEKFKKLQKPHDKTRCICKATVAAIK